MRSDTNTPSTTLKPEEHLPFAQLPQKEFEDLLLRTADKLSEAATSALEAIAENAPQLPAVKLLADVKKEVEGMQERIDVGCKSDPKSFQQKAAELAEGMQRDPRDPENISRAEGILGGRFQVPSLAKLAKAVGVTAATNYACDLIASVPTVNGERYIERLNSVVVHLLQNETLSKTLVHTSETLSKTLTLEDDAPTPAPDDSLRPGAVVGIAICCATVAAVATCFGLKKYADYKKEQRLTQVHPEPNGQVV